MGLVWTTLLLLLLHLALARGAEIGKQTEVRRGVLCEWFPSTCNLIFHGDQKNQTSNVTSEEITKPQHQDWVTQFLEVLKFCHANPDHNMCAALPRKAINRGLAFDFFPGIEHNKTVTLNEVALAFLCESLPELGACKNKSGDVTLNEVAFGFLCKYLPGLEACKGKTGDVTLKEITTELLCVFLPGFEVCKNKAGDVTLKEITLPLLCQFFPGLDVCKNGTGDITFAEVTLEICKYAPDIDFCKYNTAGVRQTKVSLGLACVFFPALDACKNTTATLNEA